MAGESVLGNDDPGKTEKRSSDSGRTGIKIAKDGPYRVSGGVPLAEALVVCDKEGTPVRWEEGEKYPDRETYLLCRCGKSRKSPFCDGSHLETDFRGNETANREKYFERAEITSGPGLDLSDVEDLCARAFFCLRDGNTWYLTENSDDPHKKKTAIEEACDCPSGRLVARDKETGKPIEPPFEPSIGLIEMPESKKSGPLWIKGGIPIESSDGVEYERRNRVTICRCGRSKNKPFCDGAHIKAGFSTGRK